MRQKCNSSVLVVLVYILTFYSVFIGSPLMGWIESR